MPQRPFSKMRPHHGWLLASCLLLPLSGVAKTSLEARYPYDPACPWGRLSNGQGMLHRCLTEGEAEAIAAGGPAPNSGAKPAKVTTANKDEGKAKPSPEKRSLPEQVSLKIGPIQAAEGEITVGRLDVPVDRYKSCLTDNGGLTKESGKVVVKFLVRAEFLRAEGTGVKSFEGMSEAAARCVAAVVDRRKVGAPSVPMTGAELTFSFSY